jgi:uncharacterized protein YmfQ (DUF2313 family)
MARTDIQYKRLLQSLLPKGKLWTRDDDSLLAQLLYGLAGELARIEQRAENLVRNELPMSRTTELISEHEDDYGLPETGEELASTLVERRAALSAKQLLIGRQDPNYFIEIAVALGYDISITEYTVPRAGVMVAGDSCGVPENIFYWLVRVSVDGDRGAFDWAFCPESFSSLAGNSLDWMHSLVRWYGDLINRISHIRPAHMILRWDWKDRAFDRSFGWDFMAFPTYDGTVVPEGYDGAFSDDFANVVSYDGRYLIGAFNSGFTIDYDAHVGESFYKDHFSAAFARPQ